MPMRRIWIASLFLFSLSLCAQTFTPSSCTMTQPQGGPHAYPTVGSPACAFTITSGTNLLLTNACCFPSLQWYDASGNQNQVTVVNDGVTTFGATNTTPIVVYAANTFSNGDMVTVSGVGGNTAANGSFNITSVSATQFTLVGSAGNGAYTSGGIVQKLVSAPVTMYLTVTGNFDDRTVGAYPTGGTFCCAQTVPLGVATAPTIQGVAVTFTLNVKARMAPIYSNALRVVDSSLTGFGGGACTNTGVTNQWDYLDTCPLSTQAVNGYTPPADGASYTDQIFGTTIWKLAGVRHDYAVVNLFSNDDQYVLLGGTVNAYAVDVPTALPHTGIYSTSTHQKVYKTPCEQFGDCGGGQWSNIHPDRLYKIGAGGTGWHQYHLGTAPNLIDDGLIYTPPAGEVLDDGGSSTLTPEDYKVHFEYVAPTVTSISGGVITISPAVSWLAPGKVVYFTGVTGDAGLHGAWVIATAPTTSTFTISGHTPVNGATASLRIYDHLVVLDLEHRTGGVANVVISQPWETAIPSMPIYARGVHISPRDATTGKWYLIVVYDYAELNQSAVKAARVLSFKTGDSSFGFEFYGPIASPEGAPPAFIPPTALCSPSIASAAPVGSCYTSAHSTELNVNNTAYMIRASSRGDPFNEYAIAGRLSAGNDTATSLYYGGGFAYWNQGSVDHMCGARLAPFLASSGDYSSGKYPAANIESVSGNTYTTFSPHGLSASGQAYIAVDPYSTTDATLDGQYTVQTVPSSTTFTLTKTPSSYQSKSGIVYIPGNDTKINGGEAEVHVARILPDGRMLQVRRIAKNLSTQFNASFHDNGYSDAGSADDYYAQPQVTLSPHGCFVGWASNLMHGNRNSFYMASTGFCGNLDPDQFTPSTRVIVQPLATSALFRAPVLPDMGQSYKLEIATDSAISSNVQANTFTAAQLQSGAVMSSLTASTPYCWRARSLDDYYVATGCFSTPAAPVGNSTLVMTGLAPTGTANSVIEYGLTSGLGSTSSAVTCSAGQQCTPSVSLARGSVYYRRIDFRDGGNAVLSSSPIEQIAIP